MADLKTAAGYSASENGAQIEIKYTVTNVYATSDSSEVNLPEAVFQSVPTAYSGSYTVSTVRKTSATISWTAITTASDYGHSSVTGWMYGYKVTSADNSTFVYTEITDPTDQSVDITGLTANTGYTFIVEPLNAYQIFTGLASRGSGTTFTTTLAVPPTPTNIVVSRTLSNVNINWDAVSTTNAVSGYNV
jgi:hypothetical protein